MNIDTYPIGRIGKAHGVKGELTFLFDDDVFDRADADFLFLEVEGLPVPFFIEEYRFRSDRVCLVKFEDVDTLEAARRLTGCPVLFPRSLTPPPEEGLLTWKSVVGFTVRDAATGSSLGTVASVDDSTLNVLLQLDSGLLLPAADDLIALFDPDGHTIDLHIPEGLLNP